MMKQLKIAGLITVGFLLGVSTNRLFPDLHHVSEGALHVESGDDHHMGDGISHSYEHDSAHTTDDTHEHNHEVINVNSSVPSPQLEIAVTKDMMAGYNLEIKTVNFDFVPEKASMMEDQTPNEGHAHVYVNGIKRARVYGKYFHLDKSWFDRPINMITVSLNANNHNARARDGRVIQDSVKVALSE